MSHPLSKTLQFLNKGTTSSVFCIQNYVTSIQNYLCSHGARGGHSQFKFFQISPSAMANISTCTSYRTADKESENDSGSKISPKHTNGEEPYCTNIRSVLESRRTEKAEVSKKEMSEVIKTQTSNVSGSGSPSPENPDVTEDDILSPPTTCCMSGCPTCVWIEYVEKLSKHFQDPRIGRDRIHKEVNNIPDPNIRTILIMELKFRGLW